MKQKARIQIHNIVFVFNKDAENDYFIFDKHGVNNLKNLFYPC